MIQPSEFVVTLALALHCPDIGEEGSAPDYKQTGVTTSGFTT